MAILYRIRGIIILALITSCQVDSPVLCFTLSGHAYGHPLEKTYGIVPELKNHLKNGKSDFVFFLGDFVRNADSISFQKLMIDLESLKLDKYFVPGNHDMVNVENYKKYIGSNYYAITKKGLKFVIIDGNLDNWNIKGEQLKLLKNELIGFDGKVFILVHQLIWISDDKYSNIKPNSRYGISDTLTFWNDIFPLLKNHPNEVYVCSGDLGAFKSIQNPFYHKVENVTLIASGMGARYRDNCIDVKFFENGDIQFDVISLHEDLDSDDLKDYNFDD